MTATVFNDSDGFTLCNGLLVRGEQVKTMLELFSISSTSSTCLGSKSGPESSLRERSGALFSLRGTAFMVKFLCGILSCNSNMRYTRHYG